MVRVGEWESSRSSWPELANERQRPTFLFVSARLEPSHMEPAQAPNLSGRCLVSPIRSGRKAMTAYFFVSSSSFPEFSMYSLVCFLIVSGCLGNGSAH